MRLVVNPGRPDERAVLMRRPTLTIGRAQDNDAIVLERTISRHHARLEKQGDVTLVIDLQSRHGTVLDGARISGPTVVRPGATFRCGEVHFRLDAWEEPVVRDEPTLVSIDKRASVDVTRAAPLRDPRRAVDLLDALVEATEIAASDLGSEQAIDEIVRLLMRGFQAPLAAALLRGEDGALRTVASRTWDGGPVPDPSVERVRKTLRDPLRTMWRSDPGSGIIAAIAIDGEICGGLIVEDRITIDRFAEADLSVLTAFANLVALVGSRR
jgi:adenylate cyclase